MTPIEQTYKSTQTEETLDLILYRPIGYRLAIFSNKIGLTPNAVTILSMAAGIIAGHLFYYPFYSTLIIGILFMMLSQALDGADGQLARMTGNYSKYGRILDGFAGNIIFVVIYIHICLRLINNGHSVLVFLIAVVAGLFHSIQSAVADYYRNAFLHFAVPGKKGELELSENIKIRYSKLSWIKNPGEKFLTRIYLNYTTEQEFFSSNFKKLKVSLDSFLNGKLPERLARFYSANTRRLIKYYNILTTNTRLTVLFIVLFLDEPLYYFAFEITVLNMLLIYVIYKHELVSKIILNQLNTGLKQKIMAN